MTTLRTRFAAASLALAVATLGGCATASVSSDNDDAADPTVVPAPAGKVRAPEAVGVIAALSRDGDAVVIEFTPDAGYEYFAGTTFAVPLAAFPHGEDGVTLTPEDLEVGDHVNVWVDACRESFPVQCDVVRIEPAL